MSTQHSKLRLVSTNGGPFRDRMQAGQIMAAELGEKLGKRPVILGIPRGGIVVAKELAKMSGGDMDIVLARKLGTPGHEELAMGALAEDGTYFLNDQVIQMLNISDLSIKEEIEHQKKEIERRKSLIRNILPKIPLKNRVVVVTDDGAATGATMQAALRVARQEEPQRLIAAIPVCSEEALDRVSIDADEVICLRLPYNISAIGQYYYNFTQIEDSEMIKILAEEAKARVRRTDSPQ